MEVTPVEVSIRLKNRFKMQMIYKVMTQQQSWVITLPASYRTVFFSGGYSAADMSLRFVTVQDHPNTIIEPLVILWKTVADIFMDGGFGNSEMFCRSTHCCLILNDVHSQFAGSSPNGICHVIPPWLWCQYNMYELLTMNMQP